MRAWLAPRCLRRAPLCAAPACRGLRGGRVGAVARVPRDLRPRHAPPPALLPQAGRHGARLQAARHPPPAVLLQPAQAVPRPGRLRERRGRPRVRADALDVVVLLLVDLRPGHAHALAPLQAPRGQALRRGQEPAAPAAERAVPRGRRRRLRRRGHGGARRWLPAVRVEPVVRVLGVVRPRGAAPRARRHVQHGGRRGAVRQRQDAGARLLRCRDSLLPPQPRAGQRGVSLVRGPRPLPRPPAALVLPRRVAGLPRVRVRRLSRQQEQLRHAGRMRTPLRRQPRGQAAARRPPGGAGEVRREAVGRHHVQRPHREGRPLLQQGPAAAQRTPAPPPSPPRQQAPRRCAQHHHDSAHSWCIP
ncbi:hypothetical protein FOCC_FOCC003111 [Frankliniella occidentalis]|nr:hypothetical protein FOCC_FOCC003111 [Frankliniella occidentalis]